MRDILGKFWKLTPPFLRLRLIRASQSKFTASAAAVITNERGEILLLDHYIRPGGGWGFPCGFLESGDSIRGLVLDVKIPMLLVIGYRGWRGGEPMVDSAGTYLEPILRTWGIPYYMLEGDADLDKLTQAYRESREQQTAVAVLIGREWER